MSEQSCRALPVDLRALVEQAKLPENELLAASKYAMSQMRLSFSFEKQEHREAIFRLESAIKEYEKVMK